MPYGFGFGFGLFRGGGDIESAELPPEDNYDDAFLTPDSASYFVTPDGEEYFAQPA